MSATLDIHPTGPFLQAGFLCEKVITGTNGPNSYIEVIDQFHRILAGPEAPPEGLVIPHQAQFVLVLQLRAGQANGPHSLGISLQSPSGQQSPPQIRTVHMIPGMGLNLHVPCDIVFEEGGQYSFMVTLENKLVGEVPFSVLQGFQTAVLPQVP